MIYSTEPPPIYAKAQELWGVSMENGVVFTYGDTCHCSQGFIPDWLVPHEEMHSRQQAVIGADKWWELYFVDPVFRYAQELEAYRVQYQWICDHFQQRSVRFGWLKKFARDLSSGMYGNIVTFNQAVVAIQRS